MKRITSGISVLQAGVSLPVIVLLSIFLVACGGGGSSGSSSGNSNSEENLLDPVDIAVAVEINAAISKVTIASPPVVEFVLTNETGNPVTGLPASAISWTFAKLMPGTDGNPGYWQSYINDIELPGVGPGTEAKLQATTENGTAGVLVEESNGAYVYTFGLDVTNVRSPERVEYVPTITHRVSFEIRGFVPVINPFYDFRPSGGPLLFQREIATIETCNACHGDLALHGGARFEIQNCVTCHNPFSADANSGNSVDMAEMTHKIHFGENLPSVIAGVDYCIFGFRDTEHCYGDVVYSGDILDCSGCHDENDPKTPQAARWYQVPSDTACGSCHDDVDFVSGENHGENGSAGPADNTGCITCHAANPTSPIEVRNAHQNVERAAAAAYSFNIEAVAFAGPTTAPTATFSVTNPLDNDAPYDLANNPDLFSSLRFYVSWDTIDYTNKGLSSPNSQPQSANVYTSGVLSATDNLNGTYDLTLTNVAGIATGTGSVVLVGYVEDPAIGRLRVPSTFFYFSITDPQNSPVPRRMSVDIQRCNDCHDPMTYHGSARNDSIEACQVCHIPDAARRSDAGPMDMKYFVHRIHAVDADVRYPQPLENCLACHTDDGFYPFLLSSGVLATSETRGADDTDPTDNIRFTPNSAACVVCHEDGRSHMEDRGGWFDACQEADGTLRKNVGFCGPGGDIVDEEESQGGCGRCHGPGKFSDVAVKHGLNL
jgi:OmcA/MtrC family decaheme c-type cytochrome